MRRGLIAIILTFIWGIGFSETVIEVAPQEGPKLIKIGLAVPEFEMKEGSRELSRGELMEILLRDLLFSGYFTQAGKRIFVKQTHEKTEQTETDRSHRIQFLSEMRRVS